MKKIIKKLKATPYYGAKRLSENLELDIRSLISRHKLAKLHGNNVTKPVEKKLNKELASLHSLNDFQTLQKKLVHLVYHLNGTKKALFLLDANAQNKCDFSRRSYTRYFSIKSFFEFFVISNKDPSSFSLKEKKERVEDYLDKLNTLDAGPFLHKWLGISPADIANRPELYPMPVWITPKSEAPHIKKELKHADGHEKAAEVVRQLGLQGYENPVKRKVLIGIVAVHFTLKSQIGLFKPTVLDALNSQNFFPGPTNEPHGMTYVLNDTLDKPIGEDGVEEYICKAFPVPVKIKNKAMAEMVGCFKY